MRDPRDVPRRAGGAVDTAIIWDAAYDQHDTGGHIEGPDRAQAVIDHLQAWACSSASRW